MAGLIPSNKSLHQTATAMLVSRSPLCLSEADAAELGQSSALCADPRFAMSQIPNRVLSLDVL